VKIATSILSQEGSELYLHSLTIFHGRGTTFTVITFIITITTAAAATTTTRTKYLALVIKRVKR
jgi:hypothetical protein